MQRHAADAIVAWKAVVATPGMAHDRGGVCTAMLCMQPSMLFFEPTATARPAPWGWQSFGHR
jgi:hypothetical protein